MSNDFKGNNLKLIGKNQNDLKVISAYSQDSVVTIKDMVFLKKNKIFIMIINRFMWEDTEKGIFRENKRIRCAIKFEEILNVKAKNINQKKKDKPLECLTIESRLVENENYEINIFFFRRSYDYINFRNYWSYYAWFRQTLESKTYSKAQNLNVELFIFFE